MYFEVMVHKYLQQPLRSVLRVLTLPTQLFKLPLQNLNLAKLHLDFKYSLGARWQRQLALTTRGEFYFVDRTRSKNTNQ
jgi:hypothetical protein